jgi:iron complex outermembrane receptor protein
MKKILTIVSLSLLSTFGFSQKDSILLKEIQISAIRADIQTPVTKTEICRDEMLENYQCQDACYILQKTPSVTVNSDNGLYNSYTYFRLRGIDQTRINMTLNGVPLNEPEDQGAYFSNYPDFISNISSIQIQRGVGTSSYGTASYAGSINFQGPNLYDTSYTSLESGYGSFNTYRASIGYNSGVKDKVGIYTRFSDMGSDGYRYNSFNKSRTFFTSIGYFSDKNIVKLTAFSGQSNNGMAYLASDIKDINNDPRSNPLTKDEKDHFTQSLISLQDIMRVSDNTSVDYTLYYNRLDGNYDVLMGQMYKYMLSSNLYGGSMTLKYKKKKINLNIGMNTSSYDRTHSCAISPQISSLLYQNTGSKTDFSIFSKIEYTIKKFILFTDIQYRSVYFFYKPDESDKVKLDNIGWEFLNPKGGIRLNDNNHISQYLSVGMTQREPTRNDLFNGYDDVTPINPHTYSSSGDTIDIRTIKPEKVIDFEIGNDLVYDKFKFNFNLYYMDFKNEIAQIGQLSQIGLPLRKNVKSSMRSGIEASVLYRIGIFTISDNINYSYNKIKEYTTSYDSKTYENVSPLLTPTLINNSSIGLKYKVFTFGANYRYVSKCYLDNTQNESYIIPSYNLFDLFTQVDINRLTLRSSINNIFDTRYYTSGYSNGATSSSYFIGSPTNYYISASFKF